MSELEMGTVYDLNKQLVQKEEKVLSNSKLREKKKTIITYLRNRPQYQYFMLLCNDKKDYTVFNFVDKKEQEQLEEMTNVLVDECLLNRGSVKGIDLTEDNLAIEIWLSIDDEAFCYYFFPYDTGVIEIK